MTQLTTNYKIYLLSFIYEEIEKNYYNAFHRKDNEKVDFYKEFLNELKSKNIKNKNLICILKNMKEAYSKILPDLPFFIDELLNDSFLKDNNVFVKE